MTEETHFQKRKRELKEAKAAEKARLKAESELSDPTLYNYAAKAKFKGGRGKDPKTGRFVKGNPGGGRPVGSKNIFTKKAADKLGDMGCDPLEMLAQLMADPDQDVTVRMRAAEKLIDYAYSKQPTMSEVRHDGQIPLMNVGIMPMESDDDSEDKTTH